MGHRVRLLGLAVSSLIAAGAITATPAAAAPPPGPPTGLSTFPGLHGVGLTWTGDFSGTAPTSYSVYSRPDAGSGWTFLGTAPVSGQHGAYIDSSIASGTTMQYSVTESNTNGESVHSAVISGSRPASDPIQGSSNAITVDAATGSGLTTEHLNPINGATVALANDTLTGSFDAETASIDLPRVAGPGNYPVGNSGIALNLTTDGQTCATLTGTLSVIDAAYNAALDPVLFSASYAISCDGGTTTYGDIRYKSTQPYRDIVITPSEISGGTPVSGSGKSFSVVIANWGTATGHVGNVAVTGPNAGDWSFVTPSCVNRTYDAQTICSAEVEFIPADKGASAATLTFTDNSARGSHVIKADGQGEVAPTAPPVTARIAIHRVEVSWNPPSDDGGAAITQYRVYRTAPGQGQQLVDTVNAQSPDVGGTYTEMNVPTGITYQYAVVAHNEAGDSPDADVEATAPHDEILLDATRAMTTAGDEPVTIASPDIQGRVAVVPGSNRIVFPQTYAGNAIDLVVASPFATTNPSRLTTMGATDPAISMDGTTVAFVHVDGSGTPSIWTVPLTGGTPTKVAAGVTNPSWLPDGKTLVAERETDEGTPEAGQQLVTVSPHGTITDIAGTTDGHEPAVSPDGQHIAFQLASAGSYSIGVVAVGGGTAQTDGAGANPIEDLSWRTDGGELFAAVNGKVKAASYSSGSGPGALATISPPDVSGVQWPAYINSDAVRLLDATPVTGKRPSIDIASAPGSTTTCTIDDGNTTTCPTKWTSGLTLARGAHTLVVTSTPSDGVASTVIWTFTVDSTKPSIKLFHLPTRTAHRQVAINYIGHDANGVKSYDVRYRKGTSHKTLGRHKYPSKWQNTTRTIAHLHVKAGSLYCVSARAHDLAGNTSAWTKEQCVAAK